MDNEINTPKTKLKWGRILTLSVVAVGSGVALIKLLPPLANLVLFGLYSIPSQMLISPFPHEPALLQAAKFYPPWQISLAGTIGCCIAGFLDYWILYPLLNHRWLRPKFEKKRLFVKALDFFHRFPFWLLVIAALSPIPFYPFKFLSVAGQYPLWKYELALIVGRAPRFFILAVLGRFLRVPTWMLVTLFIVLVLLPFVQKYVAGRKKKSTQAGTSGPPPEQSQDITTGDSDKWGPPAS